jgi:sodium-coupled neutral amino acid transporter 11
MTEQENLNTSPLNDNTDATPETPLLKPDSEKQTQRGRVSTNSAIFNVTNSIIGGGILTLPAALKSSGFVLGNVLILLAAVLVTYSAQLLLRTSKYAFGGASSYRDLAKVAIGALGPLIVEITLVLFLFGAMTGYLIIVRDVFTSLVQQNIGWDIDQRLILATVALFVIWPLASLKSMQSLRIIGIISFIFITFLSGCIVFRGIQHVVNVGIQWNRINLANFDMRLFSGLPSIFFAYTFHASIFPIWKEMIDVSTKGISFAISMGVLLCTVLYLSVGSFGYIQFLDETKSNILLNFPKEDVLLKVAQVSYALVVCFAYPMICFAARSSVDRFLFRERPLTWTRTIIEALVFGFFPKLNHFSIIRNNGVALTSLLW